MTGTTLGDVLEGLDIHASDFVVEVGGGHQPFPRSNLILDKFPFDNLHRVQGLAHSAPVLIADAVCMPIPDSGCDVLFASHIIEHLEEPDRFLQEAKRCSDRVYIEFPSRARELMFAWSFHEWLVDAEGSHLIFYRNDVPQMFGDFFHENYDFLFDAWASRRHLDLNSHVWCQSDELTWSYADVGALEYLTGSSRTGDQRITEAPIREVTYSWGQLLILGLQRGLPGPALEWLVGLKRRKKTGEPRPVGPDIAARLMCLQCRSTGLEASDEVLRCVRCGQDYSKQRGLFDFDIGSVSRPEAGD